MMKSMPVNPQSPDPFAARSVAMNYMRFEKLQQYMRHKAREKHLNFIEYMWNNPSEPFLIGRHTKMICDAIDSSIDQYARGRSVFKVIMVPFRHGKAFHINTPVLTLTGWKKHGELKAGDFVFDRHGQPREIFAITPVYKWNHSVVELETGEVLHTTKEHEWIIAERDKTGFIHAEKTIETQNIRFNQTGRNRPLEILIPRVPKETNCLQEKFGGLKPTGDWCAIRRIYNRQGQHHVSCIQVDGGEYLVGYSMVPTHNSEIISRKLPAHFLGLFPDAKILMTGHTSVLTAGFSKESRNLVESQKYRELFPATQLHPLDRSAAHWKIWNRHGEVFATGLGGSMAGQGYSLGIVDDYCKNREQAESISQRQKLWDSFTNDFLTRRAPKSITIITATPWHVDDIIGRVKKAMKEDPHFPKFEFLSIPAFSDDYGEDGTLFPERFNLQWYEEQRAALGEYGTASLLQCNPTAKGGNLIKTEFVKKVPLEKFPDMPYARIWDLAHTEKQRTGQDPDYTSGTLMGMRRKPGAPRQWEIWIKDVKRFRHDAPTRDNRILNITAADGPYVKVGIEASLDSKDSFTTLQKLLMGQRIVQSIRGKGDKVVRVTPLEAIFEGGDVYVPEGVSWYHDWIDELSAFPSGAHDDMVDNLSAGYVYFNKSGGVISVPLKETHK